jgi:hypothetical protein
VVPWVLRLSPYVGATKEIMDSLSFATVDGKRFERDWRNPLRTISSVWILHVRQIGAV